MRDLGFLDGLANESKRDSNVRRRTGGACCGVRDFICDQERGLGAWQLTDYHQV